MRRPLAAAALLALAGCGATKARTVTTPLKVKKTPVSIRLSSPAFANGKTIPSAYTCASRNVSPPLRWTAVPAGTRELALEMIDLDALGGPFVHWALAHISRGTASLTAGEPCPRELSRPATASAGSGTAARVHPPASRTAT